MKKYLNNKKLEKGQMLPWVVLMIFVIFGVVALIVDGSSLLSSRRTAQAAADAAALAGAKRICSGYSDAVTVAEAYALENEASTVSVAITGKEVTVNTSIENDSFFAKIFGEESLKTGAQASAGCYGPKGNSAMPLSWYCRAPSVGGPFPEEYGCQIQTLNWETLAPLVRGDITSLSISDYFGNAKDYHMSGTNVVDDTGIPPKQIYIIIDSDKVCLEDGGELPCDLDGDGKKDMQLGGDRGWLYLTADTSSIGDWIDDGTTPDLTVSTHVWLSGKSGVSTSVYTKMISSGYIGEVVLIPIYNVLCDGDPKIDSSCVAAAHESPPWPPHNGDDNFEEIRNTSLNYHILTFQPFYISCIDTKGNCPGYNHARSLPGGGALTDVPVIEGFFLSDVTISPDNKDGCSINTGNCQISLSQ